MTTQDGVGRLRIVAYASAREQNPSNCLLTAGYYGMSTPTASIFDLSPSEKLQLVEDLWDDLAAGPESVPVHDWQKRELARRKATLTQDPASALTWEEVKRRVRARHGR